MQDQEEQGGYTFGVVETFPTCKFFEWKLETKDDATNTTTTIEDYMVKTMHKIVER